MVRGVVDGDLTAPAVIVSETGTVVGNVKAQSIRSEGVLAGRVDADDVYLSGSVRSDTVIRARTLEVKLQRHNDKLEVTFGECILDVGDDRRPWRSGCGARASAGKRTDPADASHDSACGIGRGGPQGYRKRQAQRFHRRRTENRSPLVPPPS